MRTKLLITTIVLLAGCASVSTVADSWRGKKVDDVVVAWGNPTSVLPLNDGRKVYAYTEASTSIYGTETCKTWFVVRDGVVESSHVEGTGPFTCSLISRGRQKAV